ncbi:NAD(P)/FAD-dependent oxidoreductase [Kineococcus sp. NUM-3379]
MTPRTETARTEQERAEYDVVVVGGGAAGLSGALQLARSRRSVLVVDAGEPRNAPADGVHGLLGLEGTPPAELLARGRAEVRGYGGEVVAGSVTGAERAGAGFLVHLAGGGTVRARRLLVTTGLVDELPDVPGVRERWGRDVLHCPYCHGWEVRDSPVGVLATGPMAVHQALLFRQLTDDVVVFLHAGGTLPGPEAAQLAARGVRVLAGPVAALVVEDDALTGVRLASGEVVPRRALVVGPRFTARSAVLASLGVEAAPLVVAGRTLGEAVPADPTGLTSAPGVWVAGNVTELQAQVGAAAAGGARAGAAINADLVAEDVRAALAGVPAEQEAPATVPG